MRVPFEWLKEFVNTSLSPAEIAEKLTMLGLEVESLEKADKDTILEVNVTPNRPDCLSIFGIAREISAALNVPLKFPEFKVKEEGLISNFKVEICDEDLCSRYAGRIIKNVKITDSPEWITERLSKCSMRSVNNVVDITNYVLLELGHPLHAFDLDRLKGDIIRICAAGEGQQITTIDGVERKLPSDSLLIWDAKSPVAVAGVMGGADTEVTDATKNIFLESAYFQPSSIRRTSKALCLKSEASYRFEREADVESLAKALDRTTHLIHNVAGGKVYKKIDVYPKKFTPRYINVKFEKVNRVLGSRIPDDDMINMIKRLNIEANKGKDSFSVSPPAFRLDLNRDIDIIEEIARIYGYSRIKTTIPKAYISGQALNRKQDIMRRIKESVRKAGFNEAVNYSFMNEADLDLLSIPYDDRRRKTLSILNPLRKEDSLLRTTIMPSLIRNFIYNFSRGIGDIQLFEASKVFEDIGRPLPLEMSCLAGIYYREKKPVLWKEGAHSFYAVKGMFEAMFNDLHINAYTFTRSNEPFLHPGQSCDVSVSGTRIGFIGCLSPVVVEKMDLKVTKPDIVVFEIDCDQMISLVPASLAYSPVPKFPYVERDIAIVVEETMSAAEVETLIRLYPSELIEDVSVFDLYKGENIPSGKKSLAFAVRYRSKSRTLTETEVEEMHQAIVKYLASETGGELRS